jgi:hypothetical protein
MVQIRQGYRTDQPGLVVEVSPSYSCHVGLIIFILQKFDTIKGILTRENPELRLLLDRYFPIADALKRKEILEHYSIQQSDIQFQKWKINYQSKMISQSHSRRTHKPSGAVSLQHRQCQYIDEPFPPLRSPNHFAPTPDSMKKRKLPALSPTLQLQSIINRTPEVTSQGDCGFPPRYFPSSALSPLERLRLLTTQQPCRPFSSSE